MNSIYLVFVIVISCLSLCCESFAIGKTIGKDSKGKPTVITSDGGLLLDYEKNIAVFNKNVVVKDSEGFMKADSMKVYFSKKGSSVEKIEAFGNVFINQGGRKAMSQRVLMLTKSGKIVLTGNPRIKQGDDVYSAKKITILKKNNQVIFEPNAKLVIFQEGKDEIF